MDHDGMNGFFGMGAGWLWWILILIFIILIVWMVVRNTQQRNGRSTKRESAREVLERRYANGEISSEEYRERKQELNS